MCSQQLRNTITAFMTKPWAQYLCLGLITLLAATLRFYKLGEWSFWIDEIYTAHHAIAHFGRPELILENIPPSRNWVPISVILTAQVLNLWGVNEWSARFVSVMIGVLSIPILYVPLRKIFGKQVVLMAMLLLAVSPWHIFWSQNARFYTSLMLLSMLALFAFYYAIEHDRPVYLLLFYVLLYLASSERLTALFLVPVVFCYLLSLWIFPIEKPRGLNKRTIFLSLLPLIAFALLEVGQYALLGSSNTSFTLDIFSGQMNTTPVRLTLSIIYRISVPILILGLFGGIYMLTTKQRAGLFIFISATLPILVLIVLSRFMFAVDRYIFITLLPWLILAALGIKDLFSNVKSFAVLLPFGVFMILLLSSVSEIYLYFQFQHGNRPNWKDAYQYVERNIRDGDIVYTTGYELGKYYLPNADNRYINSFDPASLTENEDTSYWFMIDESTGWVEPGVYSWIQNSSILVRSEELFLPGKSMSIRIYRYAPDLDQRVDYLSDSR